MLSGSGNISIQRPDQKDFKKATISISSNCGIPLGSSLHDIAQKINKIDYQLDLLNINFARPETEGMGWKLTVSDGDGTLELILTDEIDIHNVILHLRNKDIQAFLNLFGTDIKSEAAVNINKMINDYLKICSDSTTKRSISAPTRLSRVEMSPTFTHASSDLTLQQRQEPGQSLEQSLQTNFEHFSLQQSSSTNSEQESGGADVQRMPKQHYSLNSIFQFYRPRSPVQQTEKQEECLPTLIKETYTPTDKTNMRK